MCSRRYSRGASAWVTARHRLPDDDYPELTFEHHLARTAACESVRRLARNEVVALQESTEVGPGHSMIELRMVNQCDSGRQARSSCWRFSSASAALLHRWNRLSIGGPRAVKCASLYGPHRTWPRPYYRKHSRPFMADARPDWHRLPSFSLDNDYTSETRCRRPVCVATLTASWCNLRKRRAARAFDLNMLQCAGRRSDAWTSTSITDRVGQNHACVSRFHFANQTKRDHGKKTICGRCKRNM